MTSWLIAVNCATDGVIESNQKAPSNPNALHTLDGYKRGLVNSLTGNLQRVGFDKVTKTESLQDIIEEIGRGQDGLDHATPEQLIGNQFDS